MKLPYKIIYVVSWFVGMGSIINGVSNEFWSKVGLLGIIGCLVSMGADFIDSDIGEKKDDSL